jgi:putative sigma-54 modulation protein
VKRSSQAEEVRSIDLFNDKHDDPGEVFMKTQVSTRNVALSESERDRIERRLYFTLGRFSSRIMSVDVTLQDENGPRGGLDKICRVVVRLLGASDVVVEGRGEETLSLVDRTANRAGRAVSRTLDMRRNRAAERADRKPTARLN